MSNDKNDRKKQGKILATIIILALATVFGMQRNKKSQPKQFNQLKELWS